jgi:hypothetical protein
MIEPRDTSLAPAEVSSLSPATRKRVAAVIRLIDIVKLDAQRATQVSPRQIEEFADQHAWIPSTALAGVVGGTLGIAGGIVIGTLGGEMLMLAGPLGLAIGAALGVLAFRGRNYRRLERATQKAKSAIGLVKTEINALPSHASPEIRMKLQDQYSSLVTRYSEIARESFDDRPRA